MNIKILVSGPRASGKGSLLRYQRDQFPASHVMQGQRPEFESDVRDEESVIYTYGSFQFNAYMPCEYRYQAQPRGIDGIMFTLDLTKCTSEAAVKELWDEIQKFPSYYDQRGGHLSNRQPLFVLVGTKCDTAGAPSREIITSWLKNAGCEYPYFHTSAETGVGVDEAFRGMSQIILDKGRKYQPSFFKAPTADIPAPPPSKQCMIL